MRFRLNNLYVTYVRSYYHLLEFMGDIGGIIEVLTWVVMFVYLWYNSLRMQQELINKGVLYEPDDIDCDDYNRNYLTCWKIFKIWFCDFFFCRCCCMKKSYIRRKYERTNNRLVEGMDLANIAHKNFEFEAFSSMIMNDYQRKILPYAVMVKLDNELENEIDEKKKKIEESSFDTGRCNESDTDQIKDSTSKRNSVVVSEENKDDRGVGNGNNMDKSYVKDEVNGGISVENAIDLLFESRKEFVKIVNSDGDSAGINMCEKCKSNLIEDNFEQKINEFLIKKLKLVENQGEQEVQVDIH